MKKLFILAATLLTTLMLVGCEEAFKTDAQVASRNLSKAADMFEVNRRIVFYNGITGGYMLTIEGRCSIEDQRSQLEVTCKTAPNDFKKHFLGLSDNVTYFAEQLQGSDVSVYHHRIVFKPQTIIPEIDLNVDVNELTKDKH